VEATAGMGRVELEGGCNLLFLEFRYSWDRVYLSTLTCASPTTWSRLRGDPRYQMLSLF